MFISYFNLIYYLGNLLRYFGTIYNLVLAKISAMASRLLVALVAAVCCCVAHTARLGGGGEPTGGATKDTAPPRVARKLTLPGFPSTSPAPSSYHSPAPTPACFDTDDGAIDPYGDDCASWYDAEPSDCGSAETAIFSSMDMC